MMRAYAKRRPPCRFPPSDVSQEQAALPVLAARIDTVAYCEIVETG